MTFAAVLSADYSDRVRALLAAVCLWGSRQPREDHCDGRLLLPQPSGPKDIPLSWYVFSDWGLLIRTNVDSDFFLSLYVCACSRMSRFQKHIQHLQVSCAGQTIPSWFMSKHSLQLFKIFLLQRGVEAENYGIFHALKLCLSPIFLESLEGKRTLLNMIFHLVY